MPRSIWKGVVSFGMVSIPVKLFTATESKDVSFNLLHAECNSRLKQQRWCPVCDKEVAWDEIVRGYEYSKDEYVVMTDEDFEKLPLASKHTINLAAFVKDEDIDPIYYEKSYYLEPDEVGVKPFALLLKALKERGLVAVAKLAIRNKERLCALRAYDSTIMLETLYYPDEIRVEKGMGAADVEVSDRELEMAYSLIEMLTEAFEPGKYEDEYRTALMQIIEAKLAGREIVEAPAAAAAGKPIDLVEALKASVDAAKKRREEEKTRAPTPIRQRKAG